MAFNAQDQSTWGVDFGRTLSPDEMAYYAPTMQQNYDRNQAMASVFANNGLDGSQWTDIYTPGGAVYGATSATPYGNQGSYNTTPNTGSISAGPSDSISLKNPYLSSTATATPVAAPQSTQVTPTQAQNVSSTPTENPYASQFADISKQLDQYKTQFGNLGAQLSGMQNAQTDYFAQQQAAQKARQDQYTASLKDYGDALTKQSTQNFTQNVMPQLRSGAQAAGQYGGSRQGIAEGVAAGNASTGLGANLASLYSQGYGANLNAGLQQQSLDNNYNLGLGSLANNNQAQNQNFYTQNRSLDQSGLALGNTLYNSGVNGQLNLGNAQYTAGNIFQNAPLTALQNYSNTISPYTGLNASQINTGSSGGGANGAIGGILAALGISKNLGL